MCVECTVYTVQTLYSCDCVIYVVCNVWYGITSGGKCAIKHVDLIELLLILYIHANLNCCTLFDYRSNMLKSHCCYHISIEMAFVRFLFPNICKSNTRQHAHLITQIQ